MANLNLLGLEETGVAYNLDGLKIQIYSDENAVGKTKQAMRFPKPLLLMGEAGGSAIKGYKIPITRKKDFVDVVKQLTDEKTLDQMKEKFQTIILDCVEDIADVYKQAVAQEYGCRDVGEVQQAQKAQRLWSFFIFPKLYYWWQLRLKQPSLSLHYFHRQFAVFLPHRQEYILLQW